MKQNKKKIQLHYANKAIEKYLILIKEDKFSKYHKEYVKELQTISKTFNRRLKRDEKIQFCKKCLIPWNSNTKTIRINSKLRCIEHRCNNCSYSRRFPYKKLN